MMSRSALRRAFLILVSLAALPVCADQVQTLYGNGAKRFALATGSPGELGLLKVLAEKFSAGNDAQMLWVKAGTGQSLNLLREGKVDMAMVHAPAQVDQAIKDKWATSKTLIGSNEFYIVGPRSDPARIAEANSAADAFRRIASVQAPFVSRGDNSGTHQKEMQIWKQAGIEPAGKWYVVTRDFMTASLKRANAEAAYFMTDSSTWIMESKLAPNLRIHFRGDRVLVNTYHAIIAPAQATAGRDTAEKFLAFVASPEGQEIIRTYGQSKFGEGLYNDANYARQFD